MSLFLAKVLTHARVQFLRHIRSPAIWWLAIAAPIGARYLVPDADASYSVMTLNNAKPILDSGVIGLQLGIVMAIILTPLAYIFLRAGPTRRQPWQAEDVTPARRSAMGLGHWIADTAALWILMIVLAIAGVILAYFRLPAEQVNPLEVIFALCIIAAPALAIIAALRTVFSMRPWLRKAGGDVLFFFVWLAMIITTVAFFSGGDDGASPFIDILGMAATISGATDEIITIFHLGGAPNSDERIALDAMAGVTDTQFLSSRLFWVFTSCVLVCLSGLVFKPRKIGLAKARLDRGPVTFSEMRISPIKSKTSAFTTNIISEWSQILRPILFVGLLVLVAASGVLLPFRSIVGPVLALLLIFPLTGHGARWRAPEMSRLTNLSPVSALSQLLLRLAAAISLALAFCIPACFRMMTMGEWGHFSDIVAIGIGLPILAIGLGHITRGPVAGRLILLILWYGYLNIGGQVGV